MAWLFPFLLKVHRYAGVKALSKATGSPAISFLGRGCLKGYVIDSCCVQAAALLEMNINQSGDKLSIEA
jgi:hypothetical protein